MISLRLVTPCAVICQFPSDGKVIVVVNAPALSAPVPGSPVTVLDGLVSQSEIASLAVNPVPPKVMAAPLATGVNPGGAEPPDVTGTVVVVVDPDVPTA